MPRRSSLVFLVAALMLTSLAMAQSPVRIGEYVYETHETEHPYAASRYVGPSSSSFTIHFPDATYIAPHFERFQIAEGDYVIVRSPDGDQQWRYEGLGRGYLGASPGGFFSSRIHGDTAIVEHHVGGHSKGNWGFRIDYFGRGYNELEIAEMWSQGLGPILNLPEPAPHLVESICTGDDKENAICYETSEAAVYDESRAVARLFISGSFLCTGWLIGDEGHMMTNEHCITDQSGASNTDYEWMAEAVNCGDTCPQLGCDGTVEATGGTLIQDSVPLDYALVLVDTSTVSSTNLNATYGFMQLRETGAAIDERIYIPQHPSGRGKEFAVTSTYPLDTSGFATASSVTEPPCDGSSTAPEVGYWADTEGGSSGSPVLGYSDHLVVALHHCRGSGFCSAGTDPPDDRNRGVAVTDLITDLAGNLPNNAIGGDSIFTDGFESGDTTLWSNSVP